MENIPVIRKEVKNHSFPLPQQHITWTEQHRERKKGPMLNPGHITPAPSPAWQRPELSSGYRMCEG